MVLHTFGRDLKWNPHIHCLISEGGYSDHGFWRNTSHFNYTYLRKKYMENPPEGMSSQDIRSMSEDALLDMDYFLNEDDLDDDFGEEGFYLF